MRTTHPPGWLGRMILRDALTGIGLPFVPEAAWRSPATSWMGFDDRLQAIEVARVVVADMRRRIPVGEGLRRAAFGAVVAGMAELRRCGDGGLPLEARRPLPTGPRLPPAPSCDPAGTLVIRKRGGEVAHG